MTGNTGALQADIAALHDQVSRAFIEWRDDVYHYLLTFGLTPAEAQDATQEVFLRLYVALRKRAHRAATGGRPGDRDSSAQSYRAGKPGQYGYQTPAEEPLSSASAAPLCASSSEEAHRPRARGAIQARDSKWGASPPEDEPIRNQRAWVFRVAHNLGLTLRSQDTALAPLEPELEATMADSRQGAESGLIEREKLLRMHRAVATLSPQQRQCLHLRAEGLRYQEIADAMDVSISTVSEFLKRALVRLRKAVYE